MEIREKGGEKGEERMGGVRRVRREYVEHGRGEGGKRLGGERIEKGNLRVERRKSKEKRE